MGNPQGIQPSLKGRFALRPNETHCTLYTHSMPAGRLTEYKDFASSDDWTRRLLVILQGAGLWVRREEGAHEPSPVQFVYISKILKSADQQSAGEPLFASRLRRFALV